MNVARLVLLLITMSACVGCDQVTKAAARTYLDSGTMISFLNDTVRLEHAENRGGFLSIGESLSAEAREVLFTFGGTILVGASIYWAVRSRRGTSIQTISAALVCGGGVGNLIDRVIRHGYVTDFLNVGIGQLRTGIFNVADFALMFGAVLLVLSGFSRESHGLTSR